MTAFLRRSICLAVASLCLVWPSPQLLSQEYRFQYFGVDDGLTNLLVQSIYQDRAGFLWVSTQEGVFRYDGDRFHRFGMARGLPVMSGTSFAEASDGTLLVGGSKGLYQLAGTRFERVPLPGDPQVSWLHGMQSDGAGRIYLATTNGLMVLSGNHGSFSIRGIPNPPSVRGHDAWSVLVDKEGIWYGCGRQLCRLTGNRIRVFGVSSGLSKAMWLPIGRDLHGDLWIKNWGTDIRVLSAGGSSFHPAGPLPAEGLTGVPATDGDGFIVFPSAEGLLIRRKNDWWKVGRSAGLTGSAYSVFRDRQGSLWIGLEGQGLLRWAGYRQWEAYTANSGFASNLAYQIVAGHDGSVWVGSESGLFRGTPKAQGYGWRRVAALHKLPIISMAMDDDGQLWLGTQMTGLARFDLRSGSLHWVRQKGFSAVYIAGLTLDRQKRLWVATENGVYVADHPYQHFQRVKSLPKSRFWAIAQAANGALWAGGASGLYYLTGNIWHRLTVADGLSGEEVVALGAPSDGAIWVGYRTGGELDRITSVNGRIQIAHDRQLARGGAAMIYFFGFDARGNMWVGTDRGVDVRENGRWMHMGSDDGLVWDDCDENGFGAGPDGTVWIGTSNGLAHFTPPARFRGAGPSNVVFTRIALGGKEVTAAANRPSVDYRANSFVVQFSSLDFVHGSSVTYRYRLLPLFAGWQTTARQELEFPGLPSGDYTFEVAVQDPAAQPSSPAAHFKFEVRTPWFRSWWFGAILVVAAFGIVLLLVKFRVAALKRHEAELMWLVEERTADLKLANEELYRLSSIDALTGIPNRRVCDDLLRREWARMQRSGEPLSVMMLDVDHFKILNDVEGHQRGDEYLVRLADELRRIVKRETDLAARYGGEEFMVVLPATDAADAEDFAESMRASIQELGLPHPSSPVVPVLTISIGVGTAVPNAFNDFSEFLTAVDRALYSAKAQGRNRVVSLAQMEVDEPIPDSLTESILSSRSGD